MHTCKYMHMCTGSTSRHKGRGAYMYRHTRRHVTYTKINAYHARRPKAKS